MSASLSTEYPGKVKNFQGGQESKHHKSILCLNSYMFRKLLIPLIFWMEENYFRKIVARIHLKINQKPSVEFLTHHWIQNVSGVEYWID